MQQGITSWEATGAKVWQPYYRVPLAEEYWRNGRPDEGFLILQEARKAVQELGERTHEAELHRLEGELTLQQESQKAKGKSQNLESADPRPLHPDFQTEAEACFLKAIEIARNQQAKSWELRASASLARLWQQQGKKAEAHKLLAEVYNWFTEGLDTKDLQEAKALLDSLGSGV